MVTDAKTVVNRQAVSDGTWFDRGAARHWEERTYWDGHNHISCATGSQWNHQVLYRTRRGRWVLYSWSQWQGSRDSWDPISEHDAVTWLIQNGAADAAEQYAPEVVAQLES